MKKFFKFAILIFGLALAGRTVFTQILDNTNTLYISYPSLYTMDRTVVNGFSSATMKKKQVFPEKVMDMLVTVSPSLEPSMADVKEDLKKEPDEISLILTNDNPIIALRRANKVVTTQEYMGLMKELVEKQNQVEINIKDETDVYKVYLKVENECAALLAVIPDDESLLALHIDLCATLDDIEQIKIYNKQRDKREDKESEEFVQEQVKFFIGKSHMELLQKISEIGELAEKNQWI